MQTPSVSKAWQAVVAPVKWLARVVLVTPFVWVYNQVGRVIKAILGKHSKDVE